MKIAPSILDANFQNLQAELESIKNSDRIHLDIMDGHYVPNTTFGAAIFKQIKFPVEAEAHLMVNNPETFFEDFIKLGVSGITFHIENTGSNKAFELLNLLKQNKIRAGISIDGYTDPSWLTDDILNIADQILIMSVKAGFGGQSFLPESIDKIKNLRSRGYKREIEVDGGVTLDNVAKLKEAGADIVVSGSFIMKKPAKERPDIIKAFQQI